MPRFMHGKFGKVGQDSLLFGAPALHNYGYMFPRLAADPTKRLPDDPDIGYRLMRLGAQMLEPVNVLPSGDSSIPGVYTYFGQFVDHNITFETMSGDLGQLGPDLPRLPDPTAVLKNLRQGPLDLESVYDPPAPRDPASSDRMLIGRVSAAGNRPLGKDDFNDLPREPRSHDIENDRAALTGDPRNDENLIIGQLHVAFLKAHNALVGEGMSFAAARTQLRQMYQSVVLDDFLPRILDATVLEDVMTHGPRFLVPSSQDEVFVPFEFSVAAYRFGHSMVRSSYNININFGELGRLGPATLELLFTLTALSGNFDPGPGHDFDTLPENWIVEWTRLLLLDAGIQFSKARKINTLVARPLRNLRDEAGAPLPQPIEGQLAVRNLLRGYRLSLPTGQAVAQAIGLTPLSGATLLGALPALQQAVVTNEGFAERTPLWFYILAEAGDPLGANGDRLGPVGSRIVAETLYNLVKFSEDSIIPSGGARSWKKFALQDILHLAEVA